MSYSYIRRHKWSVEDTSSTDPHTTQSAFPYLWSFPHLRWWVTMTISWVQNWRFHLAALLLTCFICEKDSGFLSTNGVFVSSFRLQTVTIRKDAKCSTFTTEPLSTLSFRGIPESRPRIRTASFALSSLDAMSSSTFDGSKRNTTQTSVSSRSESGSPKYRRLKDMMWVRETLEDLTAAEFACTVEAATEKVPPKRPRKRAVDYEKLLLQLNQRIRDLGCSNAFATNESVEIDCVLEPGIGMGSVTYTEAQRSTLLERIVRTRRQLIEIIHGNQIEMSDNVSIPTFIQQNLPSLPRMEIPKEDVGEDALSPKLYVRDDGTVDWDGALTSGAALRKFGTAVWARINGRESMDHHAASNETEINAGAANHGPKEVTAKIVETPEIIEARQRLSILRKQFKEMEKEHYNLLNSVISQGQAVANVKLATLAPNIRSEIQASSVALENMKVRVSFQTLLYELERIYTYLLGELGNPSLNGYIPLQDRLNVAEFGLLESQVESFNRQFIESETVDEDVLAVVFEQLTDFKRRLGIDYYVAGLSFDREAIVAWSGDLWVKTKKGLAFYVKGVRLFWNDLVFCLRLINRAAQGYTLKPREVRTLRYVSIHLDAL
jgi:hypothetical protein